MGRPVAGVTEGFVAGAPGAGFGMLFPVVEQMASF